MKVFAKALKSFNQKARLPTFRLCNQAFLTVFAQEIEDMQSKKGIVRKPLRNNNPLTAADHGPVNIQPVITPTTLGSLLESSKAFPVSAARQEMFSLHRKPFERSEECPAFSLPGGEVTESNQELKPIVVDESSQFAEGGKKPVTFADFGRRHRPWGIAETETFNWMSDDSEVAQAITEDLTTIANAVKWTTDIQFYYCIARDPADGYLVNIQSAAPHEVLSNSKVGEFYSSRKLREHARTIRKMNPTTEPIVKEQLGWMTDDSEVHQAIYDDLKAIGASVSWIWNIEFLYRIAPFGESGYFVKVMSPVNLCKMSEEISTVGDERFIRDMVHDKQVAFASVLVQALDGSVYSARKIHQLAEEVRKKALMENPKAGVHLVRPTEVAVLLKDIIGGKYGDNDVYQNKVTFDIYPSHLAMKHDTPLAFQISLPYVGFYTLFKEEMLDELAVYPGLNKAVIKDVGDQDPAEHNRHVRHLMGSAIVKVAQIEKRVAVVDAELYEYITPATSL